MLSIFSKINEVLTGGIIGVATENNETETPVAENKVTSADRVNSENTVEVGGAIAVEEAVVPVEASAELTAEETENEAAADACAEVMIDERPLRFRKVLQQQLKVKKLRVPLLTPLSRKQLRKQLKSPLSRKQLRKQLKSPLKKMTNFLYSKVTTSNEAIANVSEASVSTRIFDISTFEAEVKSDVCSAAKEISLSRKMVKGSVVKSIISAVKKLIECEDESYIISKVEYDEVISTVLEMVRNNVPYQVALDGLVQRLSESR